jgi:IS30 family transposase
MICRPSGPSPTFGYNSFAHLYHSCERGLNENTNGLIRQYTPKGKDIGTLRDEYVAEIVEKTNNRPRKCLGFKTPNQLFIGHQRPVELASLIRDGI